MAAGDVRGARCGSRARVALCGPKGLFLGCGARPALHSQPPWTVRSGKPGGERSEPVCARAVGTSAPLCASVCEGEKAGDCGHHSRRRRMFAPGCR